MCAFTFVRLNVTRVLQLVGTSVLPYVCQCADVVNSEISGTLSKGLKLGCQKHTCVYRKLFIFACFIEMLL